MFVVPHRRYQCFSYINVQFFDQAHRKCESACEENEEKKNAKRDRVSIIHFCSGVLDHMRKTNGRVEKATGGEANLASNDAVS